MLFVDLWQSTILGFTHYETCLLLGIFSILLFIGVILLIVFIAPPPEEHFLGGLNSWKIKNNIPTFQQQGEDCLKKHPELKVSLDKSIYENTFQQRATKCLEIENHK